MADNYLTLVLEDKNKKTVETVSCSQAHVHTQLKLGVNERRPGRTNHGPRDHRTTGPRTTGPQSTGQRRYNDGRAVEPEKFLVTRREIAARFGALTLD